MRRRSSLGKVSCTAMNGEAHGRWSERRVTTAIEPTITRRRAMRAIVKVFVVGTLGLAMLVGTAAVSVALPPEYNTTHCKCTCGASSGSSKELTWEMTGSCMSNGKNCNFTVDGGKTFTPGKLRNCQKCQPGYPMPTCMSAAHGLGMVPQLQPKTSQTPKAGANNLIQRRGVEGEQPVEPAVPTEKAK